MYLRCRKRKRQIELGISRRQSPSPGYASLERLTYLKVLRFNTSKRPARNYFSRREQWRLLLLVMSLGVVIIVMRQLRQPEMAERVAQVYCQTSGAPAAGSGVQNLDQATSSTNSHHRPADAIAIAAPAENATPRGDSPISDELRREALEVVRDNTYFRNAEKDAWFQFDCASTER